MGCAAPPEAGRFAVYTLEQESETELACAWFGDSDGSLLYFGEAAFWSESRRAGGDPTGDLARESSQRIGRFDLAAERMLPPLSVRIPGSRTGVWDVLHHPSGRVYFSTFFESAGFVDPRSGSSARLPSSEGFNELAHGPEGRILATRYSAPGRSGGSWVLLDRDGRVADEFPLPPPSRGTLAAKSIAFDPQREEVWVNSDWIAGDPDPSSDTQAMPAPHPTWVFGLDGRVRQRIDAPELHFVHFDSRGRGALAGVDEDGLWLRFIEPGSDSSAWRSAPRISLDEDFAAGADFVQDIRVGDDGSRVVTRWSGKIHLVATTDGEELEVPVAERANTGGPATPTQRVRTVELPRLAADGLYYTAVLRNDRVCATYCGASQVVCAPAP